MCLRTIKPSTCGGAACPRIDRLVYYPSRLIPKGLGGQAVFGNTKRLQRGRSPRLIPRRCCTRLSTNFTGNLHYNEELRYNIIYEFERVILF